jgi:type II secretory pathway pseudopilin PulG
MALTKISNNSLSAISSLPASIPTGALTLLSTQTASASASISFTSGIDSTYDSYVFKFINIHPATDATNFTFQADTGTNTNYNQTMTTTYFRSFHYEDDSVTGLGYRTPDDQAQGTSFQKLGQSGNGNDECVAGTLQIFNPSSSTFVKHFIATMNEYHGSNISQNNFIAGYFNTTTAITRLQFKFASGNIDDGIIKMYGVS